MRQRSGTRTEHARRHSKPKHVVTTALVTGVSLAAAPAAAVPVRPSEQGGGATRPAPIENTADAATRAAAAAHTDTEVEEVDVPRVRGGAAAGRGQPGKPVVAHLERQATEPFAMVGLTWRAGSAPEDVAVQVRVRGERGWSAWDHLHVHPGEGPAPAEERGVTRDGTTPLWVDSADGVQARILSANGTAPADAELVLVDPGGSSTSAAGAEYATPQTGAAVTATPAVVTGPSAATATTVSADRPGMVRRRQWGADPRLRSRCSAPRRARTVQMAFVHHTAGSNGYSRSDSKAIVRGIYAYHTQGHGWCDIGYNFLVDRFGRVFEGRAGGVNAPVRGAHSGDYNLRTVGVALMGNFEQRRPTSAMKGGLTRLLAWKLSSYYRYPHTRARISGKRFEKISGHRDAMSTACPGRFVYNWLPRLRHRVANRAGTIETPISRKWQTMRRNGTNLGQPFRGEAPAAGKGRKTGFNRGWVFWSHGGGAHPVRHQIYQRYRAYGQTRGRLGYPQSDVRRTRRHHGTNQTFRHGRIYRTRGYGAVAVWGAVNRRFRRTGLAGGRLGVPTRNQYRIKRGWAADFEHGRIRWNTSTGRTTVRYY
jgi:uncharacterized protein with LGFP repeats